MLLPRSIEILLKSLPQSLEAPGARSAHQKVANRVISEPDLAVEIVGYIAQSVRHDDQVKRVMGLLSAVLDEVRMAHENGKAVGTAFLRFLDEELAQRNRDGTLSSEGRLYLASCWVRAGLESPEALVADPSMFEHIEDAFTEMDVAEMGPHIDKLLRTVSGSAEQDLLALQAGLFELFALFPAPVRRFLVREIVAHPKSVTAALGCALLLDRRREVQQGAIEGLKVRQAQGALAGDTIGRLTMMRSWLVEPDTLRGVDEIVQHAIRNGTVGGGAVSTLKVHRVLTSLVDGTGSQSMVVVFQFGGARKVAVLLIKQGFGIKDAYLVPCSSASEQRRLVEMIASEMDPCEVPLEYISTAISLGLSDGLANNQPPAPGLIDIVWALGFQDMRPRSASTTDVVALVDPEGQLNTMSAQAKGRLIAASADWGTSFSMIAESWFEDSDMIRDAIESNVSQTALKRALWQALESRREHWSMAIARMGYLLQVMGRSEALQFAAVAQALSEGRALKKTPIMELIFDMSVSVWVHENMRFMTESGGSHR